jgi:hypothetical protein
MDKFFEAFRVFKEAAMSRSGQYPMLRMGEQPRGPRAARQRGVVLAIHD